MNIGNAVCRLESAQINLNSSFIYILSGVANNLSRVLLAIFSLLLLMLSGALLAQDTVTNTLHSGSDDSLPGSVDVEFVRVTDGIYVRYGRHEPISADSVAAIANHGFIVGDAAVAIVDPGGSEDMSIRVLAAVSRITALPVTHVIVTHVHPDHSLGLAAYSEEKFEQKPVIVGHKTLAGALRHNLEFFKQQNFVTDAVVEKLSGLIDEETFQSVEDELTLDLGNREIVISSFENAHSGSDITVFDKTTKALWAGDLLFVDRLPTIDGSVLGWLAALERLAGFDINTVIPGHGRSGDYRTLVQPQLDYFNLLVKNTREAIAQGISLSEFIAGRGDFPKLALRGNWELVDDQHAVNLTRAYSELEWE